MLAEKKGSRPEIRDLFFPCHAETNRRAPRTRPRPARERRANRLQLQPVALDARGNFRQRRKSSTLAFSGAASGGASCDWFLQC